MRWNGAMWGRFDKWRVPCPVSGICGSHTGEDWKDNDKEKSIRMPDVLGQADSWQELAGWQGLRKANGMGVVGEGSVVDFGPDFGARLSKQLKLRGTGASYNFWRPASFVGHALTFQATTPPTVASIHKSVLHSLYACRTCGAPLTL